MKKIKLSKIELELMRQHYKEELANVEMYLAQIRAVLKKLGTPEDVITEDFYSKESKKGKKKERKGKGFKKWDKKHKIDIAEIDDILAAKSIETKKGKESKGGEKKNPEEIKVTYSIEGVTSAEVNSPRKRGRKPKTVNKAVEAGQAEIKVKPVRVRKRKIAPETEEVPAPRPIAEQAVKPVKNQRKKAGPPRPKEKPSTITVPELVATGEPKEITARKPIAPKAGRKRTISEKHKGPDKAASSVKAPVKRVRAKKAVPAKEVQPVEPEVKPAEVARSEQTVVPGVQVPAAQDAEPTRES